MTVAELKQMLKEVPDEAYVFTENNQSEVNTPWGIRRGFIKKSEVNTYLPYIKEIGVKEEEYNCVIID